MQRRYRLRARDRFRQVRRQGRSYKNRLIVLICLPNDLPDSRFGFTASRRIGNAVKRNRARRLIRESVRRLRPQITPGWDVVFVARNPIVGTSFQEVDAACRQLLTKADLLHPNTAPENPTP